MVLIYRSTARPCRPRRCISRVRHDQVTGLDYIWEGENTSSSAISAVQYYMVVHAQCHSVHTLLEEYTRTSTFPTNPMSFYSLDFTFFLLSFSLVPSLMQCYTLEPSRTVLQSPFLLRPPTPPLSDESFVGHVDALASFCIFQISFFSIDSFRLLLVVLLPSTRRLPCSEMHVNFHLKLVEDIDKLSLLKAFLFKNSKRILLKMKLTFHKTEKLQIVKIKNM